MTNDIHEDRIRSAQLTTKDIKDFLDKCDYFNAASRTMDVIGEITTDYENGIISAIERGNIRNGCLQSICES